ncbi:MAG: DUF4249 domain-containing protein [Bacteroidota bacterium]
MICSNPYRIKVPIWVGFCVFALFCACTEPIALDVSGSDSVLVVDALITDELKNHEILLSRSSQTDTEEPIPEQSAVVSIWADNQQEYSFTEVEPGKYVADNTFAAQINKDYELRITTRDGSNYSSQSVRLPSGTEIDNVYAELTQTDNGLNGLSIKVDSFDPTGDSQYYRYKYEETYKVIAPKWIPQELIIGSEDPLVIADIPQREEKRICFASEKSNGIFLTNTTNSVEDRVTGFEVRFIDQDNYIISHRYSILVQQFVLNREAYEFYEQLNDFSSSENIFSESQPGFINSNVFPQDNSNQLVAGYFVVSSVSERRFFFNYTDFFPDSEQPPFVEDCREGFDAPDDEVLARLIRNEQISLLGFTFNSVGFVDGYIIQPRVCGDCTALGSNIVPDFWVE